MNSKILPPLSSVVRAQECRSWFGAIALTLVPLLLTSMPVSAQAIRITAANSSNSAVYDVTFSGSGGSINVLNTDQSAHVSLQSLVFRPNTATGQIDLLVADTSRGEILLYAGAVGEAQVVWTPAAGIANPVEGVGPVHPNGLSTDAIGNLFVVSSSPGKSTSAELWAFARNPAGPLLGGYALPQLVDNDFGGIEVALLEESVSSRSSEDFAGLGDLLVLASDPATLFRYEAQDIQNVLLGMGQIDPEVLISADEFPAGAEPGGFAMWPQDGSVLVTTGNGRILRYSAALTAMTDFASGLGNGKFKVKTGLEFGIPLAVVADNNGGDILKFGDPTGRGNNPPLARVTAGVQSPRGLAVSNTGHVAASTCLESAGGCDPLGGVLKHQLRGLQTLQGSLLEEPCVLHTDPRITEFGTCTGHALVVSNYCAGFPNITIPDYMCGGSGQSGKGFALVSTTGVGLSGQAQLVINEAMTQGILPGSANATCPLEVLGWAPKPGEGSVVEGNTLLEMTGGCGSSLGFTRSFSLWGVGLVLNESALPGATSPQKLTGFTSSKYVSLSQTIAAASIQEKFRKRLVSCISSSRSQFDRGRLANAAGELLVCDGLVAQNQSAFAASPTNPNPFGEVRGRLANIYLTINTRMLGQIAPANWPPGN